MSDIKHTPGPWTVSHDDCWVIVCNRHNSIPGCLLFWAPEDKGYSTDFNTAAKYSFEEVSHRNESVYGIDFPPDQWRKQGDFAIAAKQLYELGCRLMAVWYF